MFAQKFECFQKIIIIVESKLVVSQIERFSKVIGQMDKKSSLIRQRKTTTTKTGQVMAFTEFFRYISERSDSFR